MVVSALEQLIGIGQNNVDLLFFISSRTVIYICITWRVVENFRIGRSIHTVVLLTTANLAT